MDKEKKRKDEWITVASKSSPGRFYLFNKVTGESQCAPSKRNEETKVPYQKSPLKLSINQVIRTPAQDRLKRLQHNLKIPQTKSVSSRLHFPLKDKTSKEQENKSNDGPSTSTKAKTLAKSPPKRDIKRSHSDADNFVIPAKIAAISKPEPCKADSPSAASVKSLPVATSTDNSHSPKESEIYKNLSTIEDPKSSKLINSLGFGIVKKIKDICKRSFTSPKKLADELPLKDTISGLIKTTNFKATSRNGVSKRLSISSTREAIINQIKEETIQTPQNKTLDNTPEVNTPISNKIPPYPRGSANLRLERLKQSLLAEQKSRETTTPNNSCKLLPEPKNNITRLEEKQEDASDSTRHIQLTNSSKKTANSTPNDEVEAMDWQTITNDAEQIEEPAAKPTSVVERSKKCLLKDFSKSDIMGDIMDTVNENLLRISAEGFSNKNKHWHKDFYYFILDTNVLLRDLAFIEDLSKMILCDTKGSMLYIPYSVLQELDVLKMRSGCREGVKTLAVRAIKYLNSKFENKSGNIQAQSAQDEQHRLVDINSADDSILNCCLQAKEHVPNLLLLTEDVNLKNKAICNNILVSSKSDLLTKRFESSLKS